MRVAAVVAMAACAPKGPVLVQATPTPSQPPTAGPSAGATAPLPSAATWRIAAREHVDLWLHGFALLQEDSSLVPAFGRTYASRMRALRTARGAMTSLDANRASLATTLRERPALISAQFLALYFDTWDDLRNGFDRFLRANGDPRSAATLDEARVVATFAASLPTATDRDWARRFMLALSDERDRFHHAWWQSEVRTRELGRSGFELAWRETYRPRLERFLRNAGYRGGEILLATPLGGEGRSLPLTEGRVVLAVPFPVSADSASEALAVLAHELAGLVTNTVVRDQTSDAERRSGVADRYNTLAAVRGGALLLGRIAPELVEGYERYYLQVAGVRAAASVDQVFDRTFSIPDTLRDAIVRQIDMILGGI